MATYTIVLPLSVFSNNAVTTQAQFEDLINSQLNQFDDGIVKQAGKPLSLRPDVDDTFKEYSSVRNLPIRSVLALQLKDSNSDRSGLNIAALDGAVNYLSIQAARLASAWLSSVVEVDGDVKINGQLTVNNNAGVT